MIVKTIALVIAVVASDPSIHPWPVGPGPQFRPPAAHAAVRSGEPVRHLTCRTQGHTFQVHVETFADRYAMVIPAGIGVAEPFERSRGDVTPHGCVFPAYTTTPTGVFNVAEDMKPRGVTLGDLFTVWGQPLAAHRLASFHSRRPVRVYVGGRRYRGRLHALQLHPHDQIVIELGRYLAPHSSFVFPKGSS